MKKILMTEKAPLAIGPYSQGTGAGELLFLSGQLPICPEKGEIVATDIEGQTTQVMKNLGEAVVDRLRETATSIEFTGESYRILKRKVA